MLSFLARRLAIGVATVLAAMVISFLLVRAIPGSPGAVVLGPGVDDEAIRAVNERIGWYDPLLHQFWNWFGPAVRGDLGESLIDGRSIGADLAARLPVTAAVATVVSGVVGIVLGVTAAVRGGRLERVITAGSGVALSLPAFWVGILLVYVVAIQGGLLPATGWVPLAESFSGWLQGLVLPVATLAIAGSAIIARTARGGMVEALRQEHIRTLEATGTPPWRLRYVHALRFASVPVVSVLGVQFIALFGGTIVIEQLFALPGLGQAAQSAIVSHDFPAVQGVVVVATVVVVVTNLLLDLVVAALDPKVRTP
ncbi:ABC transporter permease [Pseudonocardia nigra]|uniref:ABC transporter permease n=1 Tax=Pseudonocardia nigra TaxID=1921578 RepID=UPI001C5D511D|nr:ABC transporter permease [Pseudonocardia nigra]